MVEARRPVEVKSKVGGDRMKRSCEIIKGSDCKSKPSGSFLERNPEMVGRDALSVHANDIQRPCHRFSASSLQGLLQR